MRLAALRRAFKLLALLSCATAAAPPCHAQGQSQPPPARTLERLRADLAVRYMEPEPHMALAKYYRDAGNRLLAFYILETARRGRFDEKVFDAAFKRRFLGEKPFDNSQAAESKLLADLARDPGSHDALHGLADIYISREDYAKGKDYLRRRGLAAYIAVRRWKGASFDLMRRMLREESQLLRYDALSALLLEGGPEGRRVALEHAAREPLPQLKKMLEAAAKQSPTK